MRGRVLSAAAVALVVGGCVGVHTGRPETRGARSVKAHGPIDAAVATRWRQIELGHPPRRATIGYLKTEDRDGIGASHWVYDAAFTLRGRISPRGQTVRITLQGDEVEQGSFALRHAILRLFGHTEEQPIALTDMPDPRD